MVNTDRTGILQVADRPMLLLAAQMWLGWPVGCGSSVVGCFTRQARLGSPVRRNALLGGITLEPTRESHRGISVTVHNGR